MRNSTNIFLTNLSIADLLVLLVCTPTVLVEVNSKPDTWVLGAGLCKHFCVRGGWVWGWCFMGVCLVLIWGIDIVVGRRFLVRSQKGVNRYVRISRG